MFKVGDIVAKERSCLTHYSWVEYLSERKNPPDWELGVPFTVFNGLDSDGIGGGLERPSFNPAGQAGVRAIPVVDADQCIVRYTHPDAGGATIDPLTAQYIVNPAFVPGARCSVPRFGNLGGNTLRSPGLNNWNINLQKNIRLGESTRIELRTEFFNVFNHPQFTQGSISPFSPLGGNIASIAASAAAGRFLNPDTITTDGGGRVIRYQLSLCFSTLAEMQLHATGPTSLMVGPFSTRPKGQNPSPDLLPVEQIPRYN